VEILVERAIKITFSAAENCSENQSASFLYGKCIRHGSRMSDQIENIPFCVLQVVSTDSWLLKPGYQRTRVANILAALQEQFPEAE